MKPLPFLYFFFILTAFRAHVYICTYISIMCARLNLYSSHLSRLRWVRDFAPSRELPTLASSRIIVFGINMCPETLAFVQIYVCTFYIFERRHFKHHTFLNISNNLNSGIFFVRPKYLIVIS